MKKRLLSTLLALCMVLALLPAQVSLAQAGDRVEAENTSLATDLFCVETLAANGDTYRLEHWDPKGANGLCVWKGVVSVASPSNGGWKLKPASDGHYYLVGATTVLTAASATTVVVENQTANNPAQQWDLEPVTSGDGFDCKIVNVQYGTELTYNSTASEVTSGTIAGLAESGAVWAIQNLSKGDSAFLKAGPSVEGSDRIAASGSFANDYFTLETSDGTYQVEHYMGDGRPCLWGAYSTTTDNGGNGGWKLTPVKGGYYRITTNSGSALAAADADTVVWNAGVDASSTAQQWSLVPDETTKDPSDCKIVNAKYNTQLTYAKPAANNSILALASEGDNWMVRNLVQTELLGAVAYVTPGPSNYVEWGDLTAINVTGSHGEVTLDASYDGPQITKVRVLEEKEGKFLEIYWDRYVDEAEAVNVDNFVLKNGETVIELEAKQSGANAYTNTLYFDKNNKEVAASDGKCMSRLDDDFHMSSIYYHGTIDISKGLTLEVKGGSIKDEQGRPAKDAAYQNVPQVSYYTQHYLSKTGIDIKADDTVAYSTLVLAAEMVDVELSKTGTGIAENMANYGCSLAVYSPHQNAYFIPEHRGAFRLSMYDLEGYGGSIHNNCVSSIAERNVLRTKGNTADPALNTGYPDESVLIHEFGHCIKSVGIELLEDQTLANELFAAYENAKNNGLWPNTYRITNSDEYFATMCAVWFNVMDEVNSWNDGTRCPLNTREEMRKYDPQTYAFFAKILPATAELPAPWNEPAPDIYHDEYVAPPMSNQVEATNGNADDLIMVEAPYRGESKLIERYSPDGAQEGEVCLWWKYSKPDANSPEVVDATALWTYHLVKTADGNLRFVTPDGTETITATSASTVGVMGYAPDGADTAQQWKFVEDTSTTSLFDGKLINVKYCTELAFRKPYENGSIVYLAPAGSGDVWLVRNVTQSAAVGKDACVKPGTGSGSNPETPTGGLANQLQEIGKNLPEKPDPSAIRVALENAKLDKATILEELKALNKTSDFAANVVTNILENLEEKLNKPAVTVSSVPNYPGWSNAHVIGAWLNAKDTTDAISLVVSNVSIDQVSGLPRMSFSMELLADGAHLDLDTMPVVVEFPVLGGVPSGMRPVTSSFYHNGVNETGNIIGKPHWRDNNWWVTCVVSDFSNFEYVYYLTKEFDRFDPIVTESFISIPTVEGGSVVCSKRNAEYGDWVNLYVTADEGYELESITVTDSRGWPVTLRELGDNAYSFTMPNTRVTVKTVFTKLPTSSNGPTFGPEFGGLEGWLPTNTEKFPVVKDSPMQYGDVSYGDWYYDAAQYTWQRGIMNGTSTTEFDPNSSMTRAMVWTVLARLNGRDTTGGSPWYQPGLDYVSYNSISDGSDPNGSITRQQLVTMLWRNQGEPSGDVSLGAFTDAASVSGWADTAIRWAVSAGILQGNEAGALNPAGTATRAEVATILMRYCENVA